LQEKLSKQLITTTNVVD